VKASRRISKIMISTDTTPVDALQEELQSFVESVRSGSKPLVDGRTARKALAIALEISKLVSN
jgi:predicted dehydrogenase